MSSLPIRSASRKVNAALKLVMESPRRPIGEFDRYTRIEIADIISHELQEKLSPAERAALLIWIETGEAPMYERGGDYISPFLQHIHREGEYLMWKW